MAPSIQTGEETSAVDATAPSPPHPLIPSRALVATPGQKIRLRKLTLYSFEIFGSISPFIAQLEAPPATRARALLDI